MDTVGLMLVVGVTAASVSDQAGARKVLTRMRGICQKLRNVWVDGTRSRSGLDKLDEGAVSNSFGVGDAH